MCWRKTSHVGDMLRGISSTGAWETREARGLAPFSMWRALSIIYASLPHAISLTCNESCQSGIPPVDTWLSGWQRARASPQTAHWQAQASQRERVSRQLRYLLQARSALPACLTWKRRGGCTLVTMQWLNCWEQSSPKRLNATLPLL